MGLESLFRTARVKEGSQGTAVLDVEKQEIIEEARITDETDKAPNEYEHVTVALRTLESSLEEDLEKQRNGETDSNHAAASHIYTHDNHSLLRLLYEFLKVFESLLLHLKKFLKDDEGNVEICEAKYTCMVAQLKAQALMSTFTAALILAWCSLVKTLQVKGAQAELLYNVGLLGSLFAMVSHILNVFLSSRCFPEHKTLTEKKKSVADFYNTFKVCQFLYTYALLLFAIAVMVMSLIVFDKTVYPSIFCGGVLALILYIGQVKGLWNVYRTIVRIQGQECITTA